VSKRTPERPIVLALVEWLKKLGYTDDQIQWHPQFKVFNPVTQKRQCGVDVAVFKDSGRTDDNLLIIAECKKDLEAHKGLDQLHSYLRRTGAKIGIWFNGTDLTYVVRASNVFEYLSQEPGSAVDAQNFGGWLRRKREALLAEDGPSFSQRQVAERVGMSPAFLNRIELGKRAPPTEDHILGGLARELRVDQTQMFLQAGKVPGWMFDIFVRRPILMQLVYDLEHASEETMAKLLQRIQHISKEVKDGKW